jgi:hypothetical protein
LEPIITETVCAVSALHRGQNASTLLPLDLDCSFEGLGRGFSAAGFPFTAFGAGRAAFFGSRSGVLTAAFETAFFTGPACGLGIFPAGFLFAGAAPRAPTAVFFPFPRRSRALAGPFDLFLPPGLLVGFLDFMKTSSRAAFSKKSARHSLPMAGRR